MDSTILSAIIGVIGTAVGAILARSEVADNLFRHNS